jgi:hypothetical protein
MSGNGDLNPLWLASSGVQPGIFSNLIFAVMMNRFLRGSPYFRRYLQPQRQDDPVLEMLMRMIYSDSHFVDHEFRLRLISQFGLTIFLMNALMRPDGMVVRPINRFVFYGIDRVKRWFPAPPAQIERAIAMLSNPFFQTPPFHLSFSMEGFVEWDSTFKLYLMMDLLRSIPSDFAGLPESLVIVRQLILTENRFWMGLVDVFISLHSSDGINCDEEPFFQLLLEQIKSSCGSPDFLEFARLFQTAEPGQVIVPNDFVSFRQVIERFVTRMFQNLPSLPGIRFKNEVLNFSPRTQLSTEGHALSARIWQILRMIHSLTISEQLIDRLRDKNFEDSEQWASYRVVYRGFELLLKMLQLIQNSNGAVYTMLHEIILIQTSARPDERLELCAMLKLSNLVYDAIYDSNGQGDFEIYNLIRWSIHSYLHSGNEDSDDNEKIMSFLMEYLTHNDFLRTLECLLMCHDDDDLEEFAHTFTDNSELVKLFDRYIQKKPKSWFSA